eukprot:7892568-Pyramimonas_sp.AAC.1
MVVAPDLPIVTARGKRRQPSRRFLVVVAGPIATAPEVEDITQRRSLNVGRAKPPGSQPLNHEVLEVVCRGVRRKRQPNAIH